MGPRNVGITVRFSAAERAEVEDRALAAGMTVRGYVRSRALASEAGPQIRDVLGEIGAMREIFVRVAEEAGMQGVREIAWTVDAADRRAFVARVLERGGK